MDNEKINESPTSFDWKSMCRLSSRLIRKNGIPHQVRLCTEETSELLEALALNRFPPSFSYVPDQTDIDRQKETIIGFISEEIADSLITLMHVVVGYDIRKEVTGFLKDPGYMNAVVGKTPDEMFDYMVYVGSGLNVCINKNLGREKNNLPKIIRKTADTYRGLFRLVQDYEIFPQVSQHIAKKIERTIFREFVWNAQEFGNPPQLFEGFSFCTKWNMRFMQLAMQVATWSKDPSTKVGAIVVGPDRTVRTQGYNGFSKYDDDSPEVYENRDEKYKRVIHAEENCLINSSQNGVSLKDCTMYVTEPPCFKCAPRMTSAGLKEVIFLEASKKPGQIKNDEWRAEHARAIEAFENAAKMREFRYMEIPRILAENCNFQGR